MRKSITKLVITTLIVVLAAVIAIFGMQLSLFGWNLSYPSVVDKTQGVRQGLELAGGTVITFEAQTEAPTVEQIESVKSIIKSRLNTLGYSEASIYRLGGNKVRAEIPASKDFQATAELLGKAGALSIKDADGNLLLDNSDVAAAAPQYDEKKASQGQAYYVGVQLNNSSSSKFAQATKLLSENAATQKNYITIALDDEVISTASVTSPISTGAFNISGGFTSAQETEQVAALINGGKLPFEIKMVEFRSMDALNAQTQNSVLWAFAFGVILILVLLSLIYRLPGIIVSISLIAYFAIYAYVLSILRISLGMFGVVGILLSVLLAVGASVGILSSMREEIIAKKPIRAVVLVGFDKAFKSILDAGIFVLIAAVVFYCFAIAPLQNFAVPLILGVLVCLITTVVITKFLLLVIADLDLKNTKIYSAAAGRRN